MKPLVLWARWHEAKLRLHGRTPEEVWGELDFWKEDRTAPFRFDLSAAVLTIEKNEESEEKKLQLDEAGVVITN